MTEEATHKVEDQEVTVFAGDEDPPADPPAKEFSQDDVDRIVADRLAREKRKSEQAQEEAERKAREDALRDQEKYKELSETRAEELSSLKSRAEEVEAERDQAKERTETLEQLVSDFVTPRLEQLPEHYRELLDEWPVEKQAGWLTKNADKLTETNGGGPQRPAGSRPTGRAQTPPRAEADKEAREQQRQARVSAI